MGVCIVFLLACRFLLVRTFEPQDQHEILQRALPVAADLGRSTLMTILDRRVMVHGVSEFRMAMCDEHGESRRGWRLPGGLLPSAAIFLMGEQAPFFWLWTTDWPHLRFSALPFFPAL